MEIELSKLIRSKNNPDRDKYLILGLQPFMIIRTTALLSSKVSSLAWNNSLEYCLERGQPYQGAYGNAG